MPLVFSDSPDECTPFTVGSGDSSAGPRIGGRPPHDIAPRMNPGARYFATLPLSDAPAKEISLFFEMSGDVVASSAAIIHHDGIEVLSHPASRRTAELYESPLPEHPLIVAPAKNDWVANDDGELVPETGHKLGGRPFFIHHEATLEEAVSALIADGYRHVLQFDFPAGGADAVIDGPWPFGDGMFHLFGRPTDDGWQWRWFWEL